MDALIITQADRALLGLLRPNASLQRELERAIVVSSSAVPADVVTMNSRLVYRDEASGKEWEVSLVWPGDAGSGRISVLSPLGTALLGLSAGQTIRWELPEGWRTLMVLRVVHQPEQEMRTVMSKFYELLESSHGRRKSGGGTPQWKLVGVGAALLVVAGGAWFYRDSLGWVGAVLAFTGSALAAAGLVWNRASPGKA